MNLLMLLLISVQADPTPLSPEQELLHAHQELVRAIETSDVATMTRLHAEDFSGIGLTGQPASRAQMTAANNTPTAALIVWDESDLDLKMYGPTGVITSRATLKTRLSSGAVITRRHAITRIWAQRDKRWQVVASQMQPMVLAAPALDTPSPSEPGAALRHLGEREQRALAAHLRYLTTDRANAQRFAPGYLAVSPTGIISGPPATSSAAASAPQVIEQRGRVLIRMTNGTAVLDEFRAEAHGDGVAFTHRTTYYNNAGDAVNQSRASGVYMERDGRWQQILGHSSDIVAESTASDPTRVD